jgi:hypothetical protein
MKTSMRQSLWGIVLGATTGITLVYIWQEKIREGFGYTGEFELFRTIEVPVIFAILGLGLNYTLTKWKITGKKRAIVTLVIVGISGILAYLLLRQPYTCLELGSICDG